MRIFFLTQYYFDLHVPIVDELKRQGHEVYVVKDKAFPFDCRLVSNTGVQRYVSIFLEKIYDQRKYYWTKEISNNPNLQEKYDLLLCINGVSFHPRLLLHLKKINPKIRSLLYLWDTQQYYNYLHYERYFDKIVTFDWNDSVKYERLELLPAYWQPSHPKPIKYDLSIIGSDHDGRFEIISKIYCQLEEAGCSSFMKVVKHEPREPRGWRKYIIRYKKQYEAKMVDFNRKKGSPLISSETFSINNILDIIDQSNCVLDTDRPSQSGATQRVVWSLARGKKIISTNTSLKNMPFYRKDQFRFIDRDNPKVDIEFIKEKKEFPISDEILALRIDRWVNRLIDD